MHFIKRGALPTTLLLLLVACASPKPGTPEYVAVKEVEQQKAAVATVAQSSAKAPAWFLQPPVDANALYTAATWSSPNMQNSMDFAVSSAVRALAGSLGERVSSNLKAIARETSSGNDIQVVNEIQRVSQNVFTDVNVVG